jgi:HAD superfamily hydrolase (TIGR01484 family)
MPKHFFFDLDKTLTASRSPMAPEHQETFERLCKTCDVCVVSGGSEEQIREQVTPRFDGMYYTLAQSGNHAVNADGTEMWNDALSPVQIAATLAFVEALKRHFNLDVKDPNDLVENRGAQISYSVIGFHESLEQKYAFDPDDSKRQAALAALPEELAALHAAGVEVTPAGTTTYNFVAMGRHKGFNIKRLLASMAWSAADCVYVGDALFPGGNDETVIGVIPTHPVKGPDDTFAFIREMLS